MRKEDTEINYRPVSGKDFPPNEEDFLRMFADPEDCQDFIYNFGVPPETSKRGIQIIWPWRLGKIDKISYGEGYKLWISVCPRCRSNKKPYITDRGKAMCSDKNCGFSVAITAGSFFEGKWKKKLPNWFLAIWLILKDQGSIPVKKFQEELCLKSRQTAFKWLYDIREAMGDPDLYLPFPSHPDTFIDRIRVSEIGGVLNRAGLKDKYVWIAVTASTRRPRVYCRVIESDEADDIVQFTKSILLESPGNMIITRKDEWLLKLHENKYHIGDEPSLIKYRSQYILEQVVSVVEELNSWLRLQPAGGVKFNRLNSYLNEFSFRKNCCYPKKDKEGILFYRFMEKALSRFKN